MKMKHNKLITLDCCCWETYDPSLGDWHYQNYSSSSVCGSADMVCRTHRYRDNLNPFIFRRLFSFCNQNFKSYFLLDITQCSCFWIFLMNSCSQSFPEEIIIIYYESSAISYRLNISCHSKIPFYLLWHLTMIR